MEDRIRVPGIEDGLLLSGDKIFFTLQGEGVSLGRPAVFLRLHMCNLECNFNHGNICDAWYTWKKDTKEYQTESEVMSYFDIANKIKEFPTKLLVITGGEPLIQQKNILKLLNWLPSFEIEIETNGTIIPLPDFNETFLQICFNCSPKLSNSGNSLRKSIKKDAITSIRDMRKSYFKFVVSCEEDIDEIDNFVKDFVISNHQIIIMPEGVHSQILSNRMVWISEEIKKRGWRMTPRLQVFVWGNTRGT